MPRIRRVASLVTAVALATALLGPLPAAASTATLVGAGDIAVCSRTTDDAVGDLLATIPGTVFTTGDNAYPDGTASDFSNCYDPAWGGDKSRTRPSPGNHDYHLAGAAGYFGYFGAAAGPAGKGYYAYDLGSWRVYSLNSEIVSAEQRAWLQEDLVANPRLCVVAYFHHPLFTSGQHGDEPVSVKPLWDILYAAGAELVLNGHDHNYERFAAQTPSGAAEPGRGIVEVVVGTGGSALRGFETVKPHSVARNASTHGVLELTLNDNGYTGNFRPIPGQTFNDSFSGTCHGADTPPPPTGDFTLTATPTAGQVALSWTAVADAGRYRVKRAGATGGYSVLGKVTGTSFLDGTAVPGQRYRYQIVAAPGGIKSNVVTVTAQ